jgi:hypothetical protein
MRSTGRGIHSQGAALKGAYVKIAVPDHWQLLFSLVIIKGQLALYNLDTSPKACIDLYVLLKRLGGCGDLADAEAG